MDLRLMGNVGIHLDTHTQPLLRSGERCVLASLALEPHRLIHVDTLIDRLWGHDPPAGADRTVASYVRTVRKAIEGAGGKRDWLRNHRPATYQLAIAPEMVDYHRFTALVAQARVSQRNGAPAEAVASYRKALALKTAEALGNVAGQWAASRRYAIELEYIEAACALYEQQLAIGEYTAVATHATHLVMNAVPTDRMISLATQGLARSGQHAAIRGFVTRAARRMWDTAQARPSPQVFATARELITNPKAPPPMPLTDPPADLPGLQADTDEAASSHPPAPSLAEADEQAARTPVRGASVEMNANHNQRVYQAVGDQYITG